MLRRFPGDLPIFGALAFGLGFLAFGYTALYVELHFGRPSSTFGLGYLFVPIWALVYGMLGLAAGALVRFISRRAHPAPAGNVRRTRWLQLSLVAVVLLASVYGAARVLVNETQSQPEIVIDTGTIGHSVAANSDSAIRGAVRVLSRDETTRSISWGRNDSAILIDGLRVQFNDRRRSHFVDLDAAGLDYLNQIHVAPLFVRGKAEPFLVVVIAGRATGRRALVTVLSPDYQIVFQQRVERFWELSSTPLEIRRHAADGSEIAVIGPDRAESLILRPQ
jgi:hypothetical protein